MSDKKQKSDKAMSNFSIWLHTQLVKETNNFQIESPLFPAQIDMIADWFEATSSTLLNPDLEKLSLLNAYEMALQWQKQQLSKQYKTNDVVYQWKDKWKIVRLPLSSFSSKTPAKEHITDLEIEREIMSTDEAQEEFIKSYGKEDSFFAGERTGEDSKGKIFYSLRDPSNIPKATMELGTSEKDPSKLYVVEVFSSDPLDNDGMHLYRNRIKEFFNYLKNEGYRFLPVEAPDTNKVKPQDLDEIECDDQFGMPYEFWGIGGSSEQYFDSVQEAYQSGWSGAYWYESAAKNVLDDLITYAQDRDELDLLQSAFEGFSVETKDKYGKSVTVHKGFNDLAWQWWIEQEDYITWEHENPDDPPDEEDFTTKPDPNQQSLPGIPPPVPVLDKKAYDEAMKAYDEALKAYEKERGEREEEFEAYKFENYAYNEIEKAKKDLESKRKSKKRTVACMKTHIHKIADKKTEHMPDGEALALYVQTLKQYLKDNPNICDEWKDLISKMPAPRKVRQDFSLQECKILYESLEYLWEKITGERIIPEKEIILAPESLTGNYWMLNNGVLLSGVNHYTIIKQNTNLICSLLGIGGMTLQEYLCSRPNKLIAYIIRNGGVRLFITQDKRLYAQMNPKTYGDWGRNKIRKLDFPLKAVKLIDIKAPYEGWASGITVKL